MAYKSSVILPLPTIQQYLNASADLIPLIEQGFVAYSSRQVMVATLTQTCYIITSTTPSEIPLLNFDQITKGTPITAIGSDTSKKIALSPTIIKNANLVVSDSIALSYSGGKVYQARQTHSVPN